MILQNIIGMRLRFSLKTLPCLATFPSRVPPLLCPSQVPLVNRVYPNLYLRLCF